MHFNKSSKMIAISFLIQLFFLYCVTPEKKNAALTGTPSVNKEDSHTKTSPQKVITDYVQAQKKKTQIEIIPSEYSAEISIKELLVIGLSTPFEIVFLDNDKNINKNFQLNSNLIFKVNESPFIISSRNNHYRGTETVEYPLADSEITDGVFRGKISVDRIVTGCSLEVYVKADNNKLFFLGKTEIKFMVGEIGGILFSGGYPDIKAGKESVIYVNLFDNFGKRINGKITEQVVLDISGENPVLVNNTEIKGQLRMDPVLFSKGVAKIRIKAYKKGKYRISYAYGRSYNSSGAESWNTHLINVIPSEPVRAEYALPDSITAGDVFGISCIQSDAYGNKIDTDQFNARIIPFPADFLTINDNPVSSNIITFRNRLDRISIKKSGKYSIVMPDIGTEITKILTVEPDIVFCEIDSGNIRKINNDSRIIIPFKFQDKYGNAPSGANEFKITITYDYNGNALFHGEGMIISANTLNSGRYKAADLLLSANKKIASLVIDARDTGFIQLAVPGKEDVNLRLAPVHIAIDRKKDRIEIDYSNSKKEFVLTTGQLLSLLKNYAESELFVTWKKKKKNVTVQYEFTYFRELNRLDYQEWDIKNRKRLLRKLWIDLSESEIRKAAFSGLKELPGKNEIFK